MLEARQWLPATPERVWAFVSSLHHMNHVIPSSIRFEVTTPDPAPLAEGVTYDYRLVLRGIPVRWRTLITAVDEPRYFADRQAKGPYASFLHEHWFDPEARGGIDGTMTRDVIRYRPPGGPLARLANLVVRRELRLLFERRHARLAELFADGSNPLGLLPASRSGLPPASPSDVLQAGIKQADTEQAGGKPLREAGSRS